MTLGWQGFRLEHPDDWVPVAVSGTRREGYVRVASPERKALQIRWQTSPNADLGSALSRYERLLAGDARRRKQEFRLERADASDQLTYRWIGAGQGRGALFPRGGRIFFLEAIGGRGDSLLPMFRRCLQGFACAEGGGELWEILGLRLTLPAGIRLTRHSFQAGKTRLAFQWGRSALDCIRWGFAEQILERYSLTDWASSALGLKLLKVSEESGGLRLIGKSQFMKNEALIQVQSEHNQIVTVKCTHLMGKAEPSWSWLE